MAIQSRAAPSGWPYARLLFYLAVLVIVVLSLVPGESRPHTGSPGWAEHFMAYAGAGGLLAFGYPSARKRLVRLIGLAAASGVLELLQHLSPGRNPSAYDALASTSGAMFGLAVGAALFAMISLKLSKPVGARQEN